MKIDNYDLDAMWEARANQYININLNGASNLYLSVVNFDPSYRVGAI
jgi:hypothetical protein